MRVCAGRLALACLAIALAAGSVALAQAPATMVYEGHVDLSQLPATCATEPEVTFTIYTTPTGSESVWSESLPVSPDANGDFTVLLGSSTPLTPTVFNGAIRYLGSSVCGAAETLPRRILASVPYAISAGRAPTGASAPAGLSPIAHGAVKADGTIGRAGSGNWSVARVAIPGGSSFECAYDITIPGLSFNAWQYTVVFTGLLRPAAFSAGAVGGRLRVHVLGENARSLGRPFHFMVFALPGMDGS